MSGRLGMIIGVATALATFVVAVGSASAQTPSLGAVGATVPSALAGPPAPGEVEPSAEMVGAYVAQFNVDAVEARRRLLVQQRATALGERLSREIAAEFGGIAFLNARGVLRIAVTDRAAGDRAQLAAGDLGLGANDYEIVVVEHSIADLAQTQRSLDDAIAELVADGVAGTSLDVATNQVVASLDDDASVADSKRVEHAAEAAGASVADAPPGSQDLGAGACSYPDCSRPLRGAVELRGPFTCSAGFVAVAPGGLRLLTAGHCLRGTWSANWGGYTYRIGSTATWVNGADGDFQSININWDTYWYGPGKTSPSAAISAWTVNQSYGVWGVGDSYQGLFVCSFGRSTPIACGSVTTVNATRTWDDITRHGVTVTNSCSAAGDSGGPVMSNYFAYGILAAGFACGPGQQMAYFEAAAAETQLGVRIARAG